MKILESKRLVVSEATIDDANFFYQLLNSSSWLQYIGDRGIKSVVEAREYIKNNLIASYQQYGYGLFKLTDKEQKIPIGVCGFVRRDYLESADIGFAILPEYEGKGYMYEASQALLMYGKATLKINPVLAITSDHNFRSQKLLNKLGLRETGKVRPTGSEKELLLFSNRQEI